jgi:phosphatidylinositol glycan class C protein
MSETEWEKVLWRPQNYPDNYVPPDAFLSALRRNPNFRPFTYTSVVVLSFAVTQHISTIFIILGVFVRLRSHMLDPRILVWVSVICFLVGYIVWELSDIPRTVKEKRANRSASIKSSILMFLVLVSLSPVLRTLTAATSSDSIWALSASLFGVSALLADYSSAGHGRERSTTSSMS